MFIGDLATAGALPALEAAMRFAGQRQKLIASNIANFDTPNHRSVDVDPRRFQAALAEAVAERRGGNGGTHGALPLRETGEVRPDGRGNLVLTPGTTSGSVLAHDRNNRDLERTMQAMVENAAQFRVAADFMRQRMGLLKSAIREQA